MPSSAASPTSQLLANLICGQIFEASRAIGRILQGKPHAIVDGAECSILDSDRVSREVDIAVSKEPRNIFRMMLKSTRTYSALTRRHSVLLTRATLQSKFGFWPRLACFQEIFNEPTVVIPSMVSGLWNQHWYWSPNDFQSSNVQPKRENPPIQQIFNIPLAGAPQMVVFLLHQNCQMLVRNSSSGLSSSLGTGQC